MFVKHLIFFVGDTPAVETSPQQGTATISKLKKNDIDIVELIARTKRSHIENDLTLDTYAYKIKFNDYYMRKAINIIKKQKRNMSKRLKIGKELTELNKYIYIYVCDGFVM